jgi:hypothetical protein
VTDPTPSDLETIARETEQALAELARIHERRQALERDIERLRRHADGIRSSRTWRALEAYRRLRIRSGLSGLSVMALRAAVRRRYPRRTVSQAVTRAPLGVNVSGYLDTESGMGEAARASIRSLEAAGISMALNNVPSFLRAGDPS